MFKYPADIFTEPSRVDPDTLANLGPLRPLAGTWRSASGTDVAPKAPGPETSAFVDRLDMQPIDPQTNGPQLFYGLRYHQHIVKPGEVETFHDQVGYWLWEPATGAIIQTLAIPRGQTAMAGGQAAAGAREFEVVATRGSTVFGISSNPFLEDNFRTVEYRIKIRVLSPTQWSYDQTTTLEVAGSPAPFAHHDADVFVKVGEPQPNPLMRRQPAGA